VAAAQPASSCFGIEPANRRTRPLEDNGPMQNLFRPAVRKNEHRCATLQKDAVRKQNFEREK